MSESLHIKDCPVCQSRISITHDKIDDTLTLRPDNLPPLAKDCLEIVAVYKRLKGLGADWQRKHGARGIIYATALLTAVGTHGGQLERACALLGWLSDSKKEWGLDDAPSYYPAYVKHLEAVVVQSKGRCTVCGESYLKWFLDDRGLCPRHSDKA